MEFMKKTYTIAAIIGGVLLIGVTLFYFLCLNHVSPNEFGVTYNQIGGEVKLQPHPGWYVTSPLVRATTLPSIPFRVTFNTDAKIVNVRIVRFVPDKIHEFIELQGFQYYHDQGTVNSTLNAIVAGYVFSAKTNSFIQIVEQ
jgi:hypothetical protein